MKKFFSKVNGLKPFFGEESNETVHDTSQRIQRVDSLRMNKFSQSPVGKQGGGLQQDDIPMLLLNAAQLLSDSIQEILSDTSSLSGENVSGFERLVTLLECNKYSDDPIEVANSNGDGCLQILLDNTKHPSFVTSCNDVNLGTALMQALRLIRMYEIKRGGRAAAAQEPSSSDEPAAATVGSIRAADATIINNSSNNYMNSKTNPSRSVQQSLSLTYESSKRVCQVFAAMCSDPTTIEESRQSLVKLLTFPLGALPPSGVHIQEHSSSIISAMCKTGFTSQQIWFLHDVQAVNHMTKHLKELTTLEQPPAAATSAAAVLLKGLAAEKKGMWFVGTCCVVDVLTSSVATSAVLIGDFNSSGGPELFAHILRHCSPERFMRTINCMTRLMFDSHKEVEESLTFPEAGSIFQTLLLNILQLPRAVDNEDTIERFMEMCLRVMLFTEANGGAPLKENVLQGTAYALLTLYSNDTNHCNTLEQRFKFLPTLMVAIPSMSNVDSIQAILTTLNYVGQCVEASAMLPLVALCGAGAVLVNRAISETALNSSNKSSNDRSDSGGTASGNKSPIAIGGSSVSITSSSSASAMHTREFALQQLELLFTGLEAILRSNASYAMALVRNGVLTYLFREPFERLCTLVSAGHQALDMEATETYVKLIDLMVSLNSRSPFVAEEIRRNGFTLLIRSLLSSKVISASFTSHLLKLPIELAKVETSHVEDAFYTISDVVLGIDGDYDKIAVLLDALSKLLLCCEEAAAFCAGTGSNIGKNNFTHVLAVLKSMRGGFSTGNTQQHVSLIACIESALRLLSIQLLMGSAFDGSEVNDGHGIAETTASAANETAAALYELQQIAQALLDSSVFSSPYCSTAIQLLFRVMEGFASSGSNSNSSSNSTNKTIVSGSAISMLIHILPNIESDVVHIILSQLDDMAAASDENRKKMARSAISSDLIQLHYNQALSRVQGPNIIEEDMLKLCNTINSTQLTIETVAAILQYMVRPSIVRGAGAFKMLHPWEATVENDDDDNVDVAANSQQQQQHLNATHLSASSCGLHLLSMLAAASVTPVGDVQSYCAVPFLRISSTSTSTTTSSSSSSSNSSSHSSYNSSNSSNSAPSAVGPYLNILMSETTKVFPASTFTYSCWVQIAAPETTSGGSFFRNVVPLFSFGTSNGGPCYFEAQWDTENSFVRIAALKAGGVSKEVVTLRYKLAWPANPLKWNHFVIGFRKPKRFAGSAKATVYVTINGVAAVPVSSDTIDIDMAYASLPVEVTVGKFALNMSNLSSEVVPGDSSLADIQLEAPPAWNLGPFCLYDDLLSVEQIAGLFLKGPLHSGCHVGADSPLRSSVSANSVFLLCLANEYCLRSTCDMFFEALGLKGLEWVIEPQLKSSSSSSQSAASSSSSTSTASDTSGGASGGSSSSSSPPPQATSMERSFLHRTSFEYPVVPTPVLAYHALNSQTETIHSTFATNARQSQTTDIKDLMAAQKYGSKITLLNSAASVEHTSSSGGGGGATIGHSTQQLQLPFASLIDGGCPGCFISASQSFGQCIASLGGPEILMPILQAASTENALCEALWLLQSCTRQDVSSMQYMQSQGYQQIAFILSIKPKAMITTAVVDALFELAVDRTANTASPVSQQQHSSSSSSAKARATTAEYHTFYKEVMSATVVSSSTAAANAAAAAALEREPSILLVDTAALYYLLLNPLVWGAQDFDNALHVVTLVEELTADQRYGPLNARRLAGLDSARWMLLLSVFGISNAAEKTKANHQQQQRHSTTPSPSQANATTAATTTTTEDGGSNSGHPWVFWLHSAIEMAEYRDEADAFLFTLTQILQRIFRVSTKKKDLELMLRMVLYSLIPKHNVIPVSSFQDGVSGDDDQQTLAAMVYARGRSRRRSSTSASPSSRAADNNATEINDIRYPFCNYGGTAAAAAAEAAARVNDASPRTMSPVSLSVISTDDNSPRGGNVAGGGAGDTGSRSRTVSTGVQPRNTMFEKMAPLGLFRVYMLRLLFAVYEDYTEEMRIQKSYSNRSTTAAATGAGAGDVANSRNSRMMQQQKRASIAGGAGGSIPTVRKIPVDVNAFFHSFRVVYPPSWFMGLLERPHGDIATNAHTLRLLGLVSQRDPSFLREFSVRDGFKIIYTSFISQLPLELPLLLPILALFFRIPMHLVPHAFQITSVSSFCLLLDLDECLGPSDPAGTDAFSSVAEPLLALILDCIVASSRMNSSSENSSGAASTATATATAAASGEPATSSSLPPLPLPPPLPPTPISVMVDLALSVMEHALEHTQSSFKRLIQYKTCTDIIVAAMINASNAAAEFGGFVYGNDSNASPYQRASSLGVVDLTSDVQEDYMSNSGHLKRWLKQSSGTGNSSNNPGGGEHRRGSDADGLEMHSFSSYPLPTESGAGNGGKSTKHEVQYEMRKELVLKGPIGDRLSGMISTSIHQAVHEQLECPSLLYNYFTAFPKSSQSIFEYEYQKLILGHFQSTVDECLHRFSHDAVVAINNMLAHVLPLSRANLLYDTITFALFNLSVDVLNALIKVSESISMVKSQEKLHSSIREAGGTARVLALHCITACTQCSSHKNNGGVKRIDIFTGVHAKLGSLMHKLLEDSLEDHSSGGSSSSSMSISASGERPSIAAFPVVSRLLSTDVSAAVSSGVFPLANAIQNLTSADTTSRRGPGYAPSLAGIKSDRNRMSPIFLLHLVYSCYSLILEDDTAVRREATRILAYLATQRRSFMESMLGNGPPPGSQPQRPIQRLWKAAASSSVTASESSAAANSNGLEKEVDVFKDGLLKLVPNPSGKYDQFLRGNSSSFNSSSASSTDHDSEENRFADFSFWVSENNVKCDKVFMGVESIIQGISVSNWEAEEVVRQITHVQQQMSGGANSSSGGGGDAKDGLVLTSAMSVVAALQRADAGQQLGEQVVNWSRRWSVRGYQHLATGCCLWKFTWNALQTGPFWGYAPLSPAGALLVMPPLPMVAAVAGTSAVSAVGAGTICTSQAAVTKISEINRTPISCLCSSCCQTIVIPLGQKRRRMSGAERLAAAAAATAAGSDSAASGHHSDIEEEESYTDFAYVASWALDPCEGPERARKSLQQDYAVLAGGAFSRAARREAAIRRKKVLFELSSSGPVRPAVSMARSNSIRAVSSGGLSEDDNTYAIAAAIDGGVEDTNASFSLLEDEDGSLSPAASESLGGGGLIASSTDEMDNEDMVNFLAKISKKGLIRRVSTVYNPDEDAADAEDFLAAAVAAAAGKRGGNIGDEEDGEDENDDDNDEDNDDDDEEEEEEKGSAKPRKNYSETMTGTVSATASSAVEVATEAPLTSDSDSMGFDTAVHAASVKRRPSVPGAVNSRHGGVVIERQPPPPPRVETEKKLTAGSIGATTATEATPNTSNILFTEGGDKETNGTAPLTDSAGATKPSGLLVGFPSDQSAHATHVGREDIRNTQHDDQDSAAAAAAALYDSRTNAERSRVNQSEMLHEVVKGLIGQSEWHRGNVYNIRRICGLEADVALLVLTSKNVHIISGIQSVNLSEAAAAAAEGADGGYTRHHRVHSNNDLALEWKPSGDKTGDFHTDKEAKAAAAAKRAKLLEGNAVVLQPWWVQEVWVELLGVDVGYSVMPLDEIHSFFKRRHQLMYTALELTDVKGYSILFACESVEVSQTIIVKLLEADLPSCIFNRVLGIKNLQLLHLRGMAHVYPRLINLFVSTVTLDWQHGQLSNFEYLMHINAAAGRSFQDLTQYPVFPWVIADYESEKLNLNDPKTFRDLSKPMGALGERRCAQYQDRYNTMAEFLDEGIEGSTPPFFYGTHYSCAGYVLHYLMRLQPYANMAVALQGGRFDTADRLFISIESSWLSASKENLQDVRELIPEFFYLPEFLTNTNQLDLGRTQKGEAVNDVKLPKWARGDPKEFIRLNREALESRYVSENLHHWVDLVFGFKQQGRHAVEAQNVFIHLTYEGEVDIAAIEDPMLRSATISQINNFGQTPSRIFHKPHPKKVVPAVARRIVQGAGEMLQVDSSAVNWHAHLSPPLCIVGAPQYNLLSKISYAQVLFPGNIRGLPVHDVRLSGKDKIVATTRHAVLLPPNMRYLLQFGCGAGGSHYVSAGNAAAAASSAASAGLTLTGSVCVQQLASVGTAAAASKNLSRSDTDKELSFHEHLHMKRITCASVSKHGDVFCTGSEDMSVRVWFLGKYSRHRHQFHSNAHGRSNSSGVASAMGGGGDASSSSSSGAAAGRQVSHLCTLVGHIAPVSSIHLVAEFSMIVSGDISGRVCLWNYRSQRLVKMLCDHYWPVISISVSALDGHICTLTSQHLRVYTLNGELLACESLYSSSDDNTSANGASSNISKQGRKPTAPGAAAAVEEAAALHPISLVSTVAAPDGSSSNDASSSLSANKRFSRNERDKAMHQASATPVEGPSCVYSPPAADWQDGVVAITGHKSGLVHLWKMKEVRSAEAHAYTAAVDASRSEAVAKQAAAFLRTEGCQGFATAKAAASASEVREPSSAVVMVQRPLRQLYISGTLPRTHRCEITALQLCSTANTATRSKDIVTKSFEDSRCLDLLVGDSAGFVSRWAPMRLDQLPSNELQGIVTITD